MNVTELARRLKMNTKELLEKLPSLGFDIGRRAIKVDDLLVDKIVMAVEEDRKRRKIQQREGKIREIKLGESATPVKDSGKGEVNIPEQVAVRDFAEILDLPVNKVMAELIKNGVMSSLNERIDYETAAIIAEDLGYRPVKLTQNLIEETKEPQIRTRISEILAAEDSGQLVKRPPVVIVMGHVDHGKTKLLDAIRQTNVVEGESGGITQHIGAYQVVEKGKKITFLDTPGHEAFKSMRSRGGQVADLAIIVVAADEGLKPQTLEVINIVQKENLPFIIAINKIDKEGADPERVKKELAEINLIPEDWGGKTICVPISAKQKLNITELLDMVLLVADLESFKTNPNSPAVGTIIESHVDRGEGPVATVLVQNGTLKTGDYVIAGRIAGRIKAMRNYLGEEIDQASPATPVKILGLRDISQVGDILEATEDKKKIRAISKNVIIQRSAVPMSTSPIEESESEEEKIDILQANVVLKCDVLGSQEAILEAFQKFTDPEVKLKVIKKGLGNVTEADVLAAQTANGLVLAFRVRALPSVEELAKDLKIEILHFEVIYRLLEEVETRLKALVAPSIVRTQLGRAKVLEIFRRGKNEMIIGCKVLEGAVKNKTKVKVLRQDQLIAMGDLVEIQSGKEKVNEAVKDEDCGMLIKIKPLIEVGDLVEVYQDKSEQRKLGQV